MTEWLVVSFAGIRERRFGGKPGHSGPHWGPLQPVGTIGFPLTDDIRRQLLAYGWTAPSSKQVAQPGGEQ